MKSDKGYAGFKLWFLPAECGDFGKKLGVFCNFTFAERGKVSVIGGVADKKRVADNIRAQPSVGLHSS